uniref:Transporter n=1 Tax=Candidatus Nitrotoga fabula TaxID=2182327 RepID=A0A2X0SE58_9PROT|nr:conserved protein of unknown function [Candidatus Nitrotoga fabula]
MKKYLLTGLLVWVPLGITIWVLSLTISTLDQSLLLLPEDWYPDKFLGVHIPGLGVILTVVILLCTGLLVHNVLGQRLLTYWEGLLKRIPVVNGIYHSVKQVSDTLLSSKGLAFRKVLLVKYPHPEAWSLAFLTGIPGEVTQILDEEYVGVFIPTAPSPVNGFYFYVRRSDTRELDISVDMALKSIISMGVVASSTNPPKPQGLHHPPIH